MARADETRWTVGGVALEMTRDEVVAVLGRPDDEIEYVDEDDTSRTTGLTWVYPDANHPFVDVPEPMMTGGSRFHITLGPDGRVTRVSGDQLERGGTAAASRNMLRWR